MRLSSSKSGCSGVKVETSTSAHLRRPRFARPEPNGAWMYRLSPAAMSRPAPGQPSTGEMMTDADELVRQYVHRKFLADHGGSHLAGCSDMTVVVDDAYNGGYGCDTGCEYVRFEATVSCPHQAPIEYEFGEFDDLGSIIKDMQRDEERQ